MKCLTLHIAILFITIYSSAPAQSIISGAENNTTSEYIVNWTIGNTITGSATNEQHQVTQGTLFNTYRMYYDEGANLKINCFPNPFKEYFFLEIKSNTPEQYTWLIISESGKIIKREQAYKSLLKIDISTLNAHLYYLSIQDKKGKIVASAKLLKK